jgi:ATP-dependent protease HslVU (ClpYQ) peptidase subunit
MTCIIGYKSGNQFYLAADGAATTEDGDIRPIKIEKIIRVGEYLIGFAGSIRTGQLLGEYYMDEPTSIEDLVETIRTNINSYGCGVTTDAATTMCQSCFIVIHKDKMYEILSDLQLNEIEGDFTCIGSGQAYAFGAMDVIHDLDLSPSDKLKKALDVVSKYQATVREPYTVVKY